MREKKWHEEQFVKKVKMEETKSELILVSGPKGWYLEKISYGYQLHTEPKGEFEEDVFTILSSPGQHGGTAIVITHTAVDFTNEILLCSQIKGFDISKSVERAVNSVIKSWNRTRLYLQQIRSLRKEGKP